MDSKMNLDSFEENTRDMIDYVRQFGGTWTWTQHDEMVGEIGLADYRMIWDESFGDPARVYVWPAGCRGQFVVCKTREEFVSAVESVSDPSSRRIVVARSCMLAVESVVAGNSDGRTLEDLAMAFGQPFRVGRKEVEYVLEMTLREIAYPPG